MFTITLRDLQWRARRFGLGVAATALVFSTTLLLLGVNESFRNEARTTLATVGADAWLVPTGTSGPFTAVAPVAPDAVSRVAGAPGVRSAEPIVLFRHMARHAGKDKPVNLVGASSPGIVSPPLVAGRAPRGPGQAVADENLDVAVGERIGVGPARLEIVGLTRGLTYFAGVPAIVVPVEEARRLAYDGQPLASAVITRGVPDRPVAGLKLMTPDEVLTDLQQPTKGATSSLSVVAAILSLVAMGIIGLMAYLAGLDRLPDFAVFKAIGVRTGKLLGGLVLQTMLLTVSSALVAFGIAKLVAPAIPIGVHFSAGAYLTLLGLAIVVGLLVSLVSVRQATGVDPAVAFGRN